MNAERATVEVPCPLCGTADKKLLGTFHFQGQILGLVECEECCLVYVSPRLSEEAMEVYFQTYTDVSSLEKIARWRAYNQPKIEQDLNILKSLLPRGKRILDIGCGYGFFQQQAREIGYETVGVEISRPACEYASKELGLDVRQGYLKEMGFKLETFDAVALFDVLYYLNFAQTQR